MAKFVKGNMFTRYGRDGEVILVTTNSVVKNNGELVMGAGAAKAAKAIEPELPLVFAQAIKDLGETRSGTGFPRYGVLFDINWVIGAFQTKYHYSSDSTYELVSYSAAKLNMLALEYPDAIFNVNMPGVGLGRLNASEVKSIMSSLPDNVHIWIN